MRAANSEPAQAIRGGVPPAASLSAQGLSKSYGATRALQDVSLELVAGEVHCLLGENGAGKSTLVKIIAGLEREDSGALLIRGKAMEAASVQAARAAGIAKALSEDIQILILDEPTAALPDKEVGSLFSIVRRLAESGAAILFISHRLDEVFEIGDRVTVLRDGRKVATDVVAAVTKDRLIEMMVGRHVDETARQRLAIRKPALEVRGWCRRGVIADVTFSVGHGEILGFAGLVGSGGSDVARSLFAVEPCDAGELRIDGKVVKPRSQHQMMACGLAFVPGDRQGEGLFSEWSLTRNITLPVLGRISSWASIPRRRVEEDVARRYIARLDVRPGTPSELVRNLSGGNQQKVLLSKWLASSPKVPRGAALFSMGLALEQRGRQLAQEAQQGALVVRKRGAFPRGEPHFQAPRASSRRARVWNRRRACPRDRFFWPDDGELLELR
jgi:ABC-type sugar transport system ATPase subunit